MADSRCRRPGFSIALLASSALLVAAWGAPARADPGGGGAFKIVGASFTQEVKFASCMRRHGVPNFPDPNSSGVFSLVNIDPNSPQYERAQKACQKLLPKRGLSPAEQAKLLDKALAFAKCMRSHGVANFPDPSTKGGGITFSMNGVDPRSPQFQRAATACRSLSLPAGGPGSL